MRTFLLISKQGDGYPLMQRVVDEGHRAVVYINDKKTKRIGDGLIEKSLVKEELISKEGNISSTTLKKVMGIKPDVVVMDMVGKGFGKLADNLRKQGYPVIGGSMFGDQVELDRPYGNRVMKLVGIQVPKTTVFTDYKKAIRFVEEQNKAFVYKPSGNKPTFTTYVAQGVEDMIGVLKHYSSIGEEFELQERVDGVEISTEVWFNGKEFVSVNHTMEEKTLMVGGIGPKTGSMGSVVWVGSTSSRLFKEGIGKTLKALQRAGYRGPIDLNTIITKDKIYGLEFTARFGYDAIFTLLESFRDKLSDLLYGMATGVIKTMRVRKNWNLGAVFCVEPYPIPKMENLNKGILLQGFNRSNLKHIWFYDVLKSGDEYQCAGASGNLGVVTARGETVREARRRVYRTMKNLVIPDVMYRTDIGERVMRDIHTLKEWGWL